jgi:hypothetical protein
MCELCGDDVIEGGEQCEAGDLQGKTCEALGFVTGSLSCSPGCTFDISGCYSTRFDAFGPAIIDRVTGLEWEKKDSPDGVSGGEANPHDVDNVYNWCANPLGPSTCRDSANPPDGSTFIQFLWTLNGGASGDCYLGHCDWRLPTLQELKTIAGTDCTGPPCTADDAFLPLQESSYWSSTTNPDNTLLAFMISFVDGSVQMQAKPQYANVRAVRGGI